MIKRLLLSLLLLAALAGGWRPAVAGGMHGGVEHMAVAAPQVHQFAHAHAHADVDATCDQTPQHRQHAADGDDQGHAQDMSRCAAMTGGCFAPVMNAGGLDVARKGEALRLRQWDRPDALLPPVALTPDLRPPRASL